MSWNQCFKLVYMREEVKVIGGSVSNALDENINISNISKVFSGFQINLRTSKNKASKQLSETKGARLFACMSPSRSPVKQSVSASPPASISSAKASANSSASPSPAEQSATSPLASGSSTKLSVASPSASGSPAKQFVASLSPGGSPGRSGSRSHLKRVASPSRPRSAAKKNEQEFSIYGQITVVQDEQNETNVSFYNLDKDVMKFLMGRFSYNSIKQLKYVRKDEALHHCSVQKIADPFEGAKR